MRIARTSDCLSSLRPLHLALGAVAVDSLSRLAALLTTVASLHQHPPQSFLAAPSASLRALAPLTPVVKDTVGGCKQQQTPSVFLLQSNTLIQHTPSEFLLQSNTRVQHTQVPICKCYDY